MVILSIQASPYQNNTSFESQEDDDYFNDTLFTSYSEKINNINNKTVVLTAAAKSKNFKLPGLVNVTFKENRNNSNKSIAEYTTQIITTVPPNLTSTFLDEGSIIHPTVLASENLEGTDLNENTETLSQNFFSTHLIQTTDKVKVTKNYSEIIYFTSPKPKNSSNGIHLHSQQYPGQYHYKGKTIRKHHRQRKTSASLAQRTKHPPHHNAMKLSSRADEPNNNKKHEQFTIRDLDLNNLDEINFPYTREKLNGGAVHENRPSSFEELDYGHARVAIYPKSSTTISTTTRDSNIHIVKPEKLPEIIPSTPLSSNSKIIEIKKSANKRIKREISLIHENHVEIEPEYLVGDLSSNDSSEYIAETNPIESSTTTSKYNVVRLDGFAGMLQLFFGVDKPIDVNVFNNPPSAEFVNLMFALLVWSVRYPAVFWTTAKSFATIFSVQMIASAADIIFSFVGISSLFKLQIYSQGQPIQNQGLVLNAGVTLALFLLSVILILSSSMVLYLYGHGRLSAKMRDRAIISLRSNDSWIYFSHCASLCFVLALSVVKAPLLNDLSATYRNNLHCPTFMAGK